MQKSILSLEFLLADWPGTIHLLGAFCLHLFFSFILVFALYYQKSKRRTFAFSFLLIGAVVFLLSFLLSDIKIKLGLALGLFAIFGIIRYRTMQIPIREMTYLFSTIGMSVINALTAGAMSLTEVLASNLILLALFAVKEKVPLLKNLEEKNLVYSGVDKAHPSKRAELIAELREKTGLPIERIGVVKYNLMKDSVVLRLYFHSRAGTDSEETLIVNDEDDD